eukprot:XP_011437376.1 PREDICTED: uncharacterized protein LOC105335263 [Crassostrea gigas]
MMSVGNTRGVICNSLGKTPLHLAAEESDVNKMEELLSMGGYDVNAQDFRGKTPLHCLFDKNKIDDMTNLVSAMSILLRNGADLNIKDKFQDTPLHEVFYNYDAFTPMIIRYLLKNSNGKFDIESRNNVGYNIFYRFMTGFRASLREEDDFQQIVEDTESFINDFLDCKIIQPCPVKRLLNTKDNYGCSAFQLYINQLDYREETIKKMIKMGADVNTQSAIGVTPLMDAVLDRVAPLAEILLQAGADVNIRDIFGQTALFRVLTTDCFNLLKQHGSDFTICDIFGRPPITDVYLYSPEDSPRSGVIISDFASQRQPVYKLFLENGVSVHAKDKFGSSLLHYAAWYGAQGMAEALLKHGVPRNVTDNNGITPAELAWRVGNYELCNFLSDQPNEADYKDPVKRHYINLLVYHEDVKSINEILPEVEDFQENPAELLNNLISSPKTGIVFKESEAHEVKKEVLKLMDKIAILISTTDPAFRCTVHPTGSSEDGSKIGEADEFDFTFCLNYFSEECIPYQDEDMMNTGFATLKLKSFHESHPLLQYLADEHVIESFIVRDTFQDLFTNAVNNSDTWKENVFYFDGLLNFPIDKPILNMEIHWCGPIMKEIVISIDVVPAVYFPRWMPKEMGTRNQDLAIQGESVQDGCFLLFQPPEVRNKERRKYLRISRFSSEMQYLKSLPDVYLESYAAAKILISNQFCPRLLFSEEFNFDEIFVDSSDKASSSDEYQSEKSDNSWTKKVEMVEENDNLENQEVESEMLEDTRSACSQDGESCSGLIQGTILYKNGGVCDLSRCVIEVDETLRCTRLFTPKENQRMEISNLSFYVENGELRARKCSIIRTIQKDTSRWIHLGPALNVREQESLDKVITKSLTSQENQNLTVAEWLERTFPLTKKASDNESVLEANDQDGNCRVRDDKDKDCLPEQPIIQNMETDNCLEIGQNSMMGTSSNARLKEFTAADDKDVPWEGGEIIDGYGIISSYMLKNCLFCVANDLKDADKSMSHLDITIKLFEKLQSCAKAENLVSFFLPYLNVFTFANEHIKMIPEDEVLESTRIQCHRIQLFCEVILGILRQNMQNTVE